MTRQQHRDESVQRLDRRCAKGKHKFPDVIAGSFVYGVPCVRAGCNARKPRSDYKPARHGDPLGDLLWVVFMVAGAVLMVLIVAGGGH